MVTIYTSHASARLDYILNLVFGRWLGADFRIVHDVNTFISAEGIRICYHEKNYGDALFIKSAGLLDEHQIKNFIPEFAEIDGLAVLFPVNDPSALITFDIFSAIFWMVSRYEEYLDFIPDIHGRFEASSGFAFQKGFHRKPVVDHWLMLLVKAIQQKYPLFKPVLLPYSFIPTYDIDQAWAYLHKNVVPCLAAASRDYLKGRRDLVKERVAVLSNEKPDPYDSYDYQFELQKKYGLAPIYFFHPGTHGKFDKNLSSNNPEIKNLIGRIAEHADIGLHCSYRSFDSEKLLEKEVERMSQLLGAPVKKCRNHFLRIKIPGTYRNYISCGITDDFSLGWASDIGFRAGTSRSFPFYDMEKERETALMVHPFSMMDGALKNYLKIPPANAGSELKKLIDEIRSTGGTFISLWHNHSLGTMPEWAGWRNVYENMIREAVSGNTL